MAEKLSSRRDARKIGLLRLLETWQNDLGHYGARYGALLCERLVIVATVYCDHEVELREYQQILAAPADTAHPRRASILPPARCT